MITNRQLQILHIARRTVERLSNGTFDEAAYRTTLRSLGRVESSKDLDQQGFEDVMAYLESHGFTQDKSPADYWQNIVANRGRFASSRQVHEINRLARLQRYELPALCKRWSGGRCWTPSKLIPAEAYKLIEMLKSCVARSDGPPSPQPTLVTEDEHAPADSD